MARVVLGARRRAGRPVEPVVEGAEADEEEQRRGDQRDEQDRRSASPSVSPPPDGDREAVERAGRPTTSAAQNSTPRTRNGAAADQPGCAQSSRHQPPSGHFDVTLARYFTSASSWAGWSVSLEVWRHDARLSSRCAITAFGSTIDCLMNAASLPLRTLSRSGPIGAGRAGVGERVAGAAARRRSVKIVLPSGRAAAAAARAAAAGGRRLPAGLRGQPLVEAGARESTCASERMTAWPRPHSSAQTTG